MEFDTKENFVLKAQVLIQEAEISRESGHLESVKEKYLQASLLYSSASYEATDTKTKHTLKTLCEIYYQKSNEIFGEYHTLPILDSLVCDDLKESTIEDKAYVDMVDEPLSKSSDSSHYSVSPFRAIASGFQTMRDYVIGGRSSGSSEVDILASNYDLLKKRIAQLESELDDVKVENTRLRKIIKMNMPKGLNSLMKDNITGYSPKPKTTIILSHSRKSSQDLLQPTYEELLELNEILKQKIVVLERGCEEDSERKN